MADLGETLPNQNLGMGLKPRFVRGDYVSWHDVTLNKSFCGIVEETNYRSEAPFGVREICKVLFPGTLKREEIFAAELKPETSHEMNMELQADGLEAELKKANRAKAQEAELVAGAAPEYPGWEASGYVTRGQWADIHAQEADYRFTGKVKHYNDHPSGVECQEIIRECKDPMVAFAMKHLWRSQWGNKPGAPKELDLKKAIEYLQLELAREQGEKRL